MLTSSEICLYYATGNITLNLAVENANHPIEGGHLKPADELLTFSSMFAMVKGMEIIPNRVKLCSAQDNVPILQKSSRHVSGFSERCQELLKCQFFLATGTFV